MRTKKAKRMENNVETTMRKQIDELSKMPVSQLRQKYLEAFGEEARSHHRQFLFRRIAWRIQALAEGGLSERARRRALEIANDTEFGLTGAIYTKSRDKIDRAKRDFHVGNLYINRKCTGAMVGAHPFGGFNMSGTDSKSGGPDYLYLFTQAKSVAEKIV